MKYILAQTSSLIPSDNRLFVRPFSAKTENTKHRHFGSLFWCCCCYCCCFEFALAKSCAYRMSQRLYLNLPVAEIDQEILVTMIDTRNTKTLLCLCVYCQESPRSDRTVKFTSMSFSMAAAPALARALPAVKNGWVSEDVGVAIIISQAAICFSSPGFTD